jgi:hypothetical protein
MAVHCCSAYSAHKLLLTIKDDKLLHQGTAVCRAAATAEFLHHIQLLIAALLSAAAVIPYI